LPAGLAGAEVSCGLLLALAGAGKAWRGVRGIESATAIRRALRVPRGPWRAAELAAAAAECATAAAILIWPAAAGAALAALGAVFCGLLGYVKATGVPGGCGCLGWQPRYKAHDIGARAIARAAVLAAVGAASAVTLARAAAPGPGGAGGAGGDPFGINRWFWGGGFGMAIILALLSAPAPRTPRCGRPLWRPARGRLRALAGHDLFAAMAAGAGPFGAETGHRRAGCDDEFWFWPHDGAPVVFAVGRAATDGALAVRTARAGPADDAPARRLPAPVPGARPPASPVFR
jgi:methylamine utilization protein MauE